MVDPIGSNSVSRVDTRPAPVAPVSAVSAVRPATSPISGAATGATTIAKAMAAAPPVDVERIARIKKAVADGTFPIMPAKIADRLLALKLEWNPHDQA